MAFLFSPGRPQVGAVRVLALVAGVTASAVPGVAPAAAISVVPDRASLPQFPERIATIAIGNPAIVDAMMRAGGPACVTACGRGWVQRDLGRFSV
jgi:putative type II/III system pilus formation protein